MRSACRFRLLLPLLTHHHLLIDLQEVESRNTIAEIRGSELPDEIVLISGHVDSWDIGQVRHLAIHVPFRQVSSLLFHHLVGHDSPCCIAVTFLAHLLHHSSSVPLMHLLQGAMDDAGPAFVALQALILMKRLNLRPKRTVRWVGWTTEERGRYAINGGTVY